MNSQGYNVITPIDGALVITGLMTNYALALITGNSPVLATIAGATVTGLFLSAIKIFELWWKARADTQVAELRRQLRDAGINPRA